MRSLLVLCAVLSACAEDATQLVVWVDSDLVVPEELVEVRAVTLDAQGGVGSEHTFQLSDTPLPFSFGLTPENTKNLSVTIEMTAIGPNGPLFTRRAVTEYVLGKTLLLRMFLARQCKGVTCEAGLTCTENGCESEVVPPSSLIEIEPGGETQIDGGVGPDAGTKKPAIIVDAEEGLRTTEAGGTASFEVSLTHEPASFVILGIVSSDEMEGVIETYAITFTSLDWNEPKTVTVTGIDDLLDDGDRTYSVTMDLVVSRDLSFQDLEPVDVQIINEDDDRSQILLLGSEGLSTTERGGTASFRIALGTQPTQDVVLLLASSDPTEGTVATASITFPAAAWDIEQEVIVTGVDDDEMDGPQTYTIGIDPSLSPDDLYRAAEIVTVSLTNSDDETPGVTVSPARGLTTTEAGGTASFMVVLNTRPSGPVSIGLSSSNTAEGTIAPDNISFDDQSWSVPQSVTITGVDDTLDDGDVEFSVIIDPALSADPAYAGVDADDVTAVNVDDEASGIDIAPANGLVTSESGEAAVIMVRLRSPPAGVVQVDFMSTDPSEGTVEPAQLDFGAEDWSTPKIVTITGVDDELSDGPIGYQILTAALSSDPQYAGIDPIDLFVTNADNDTSGITIAPTALQVSEDSRSGNFTVQLTTMPTADVSIALSSSDGTEAMVAPAALTFTPSNWTTPQTVTVTAVNDDVDDGDVALSIVTAPAVSADQSYANFDPQNVSIIVQDDDTAGFMLGAGPYVTSEAGGTVSFSVQLTSQPTADVTLGFSSNDTTEGTVSPASITFTSADWSAFQWVTVTGVNDAIDDGNVSYTIVTAAAQSADAVYAGLNPPNLTASNTDDDTAGITVTPSSGIVTRESGVGATFTVRLDSQPTFDVTMPIGPQSNGEVSIPISLVLSFNATNWNVPQTVTLTPVDDGTLDGDRTWTITTPPAQSGDANYNGRDAADVTGTSIDDGDLPATLIGAPSGGTPSGISESVSISTDGRLVAFESTRTDLVAGDTNGARDVFVFYRGTRSLVRASVSSAGVQANADCDHPRISADGRWVVFRSAATNLVAGDTNSVSDVFLRDLMTGTTTRISVTSNGAQGTEASDGPAVSSDGRYLLFHSTFDFDTNGNFRVYRHDRTTGQTIGSGNAANPCFEMNVSTDGRFAFYTVGVPDDVILYDHQLPGQMSIGPPTVNDSFLTPDGAWILYRAGDDASFAGDTNGFFDAFIRNRITEAVEIVSLGAGGERANGDSDDPTSSDDGRWVVFNSRATNLGPAAPSGNNLFIRDRNSGSIQVLAFDVDDNPRISGDGRFVAYGAPLNSPSIYLIAR
jgi:hypothetical protein